MHVVAGRKFNRQVRFAESRSQFIITPVNANTFYSPRTRALWHTLAPPLIIVVPE